MLAEATRITYLLHYCLSLIVYHMFLNVIIQNVTCYIIQ